MSKGRLLVRFGSVRMATTAAAAIEAEVVLTVNEEAAAGKKRRCKCSPTTGYQRQAEGVAENVYYPCIAVDWRYKLLRPCSQRATEVLVYRGKEKIYCKAHEVLFRRHRQCRYCGCFCYQGEFILCDGDEGGEHWTCGRCFRESGWRGCSHCGDCTRQSRRVIYTPEKNALFRCLASRTDLAIDNGKQLNLLAICGEDYSECEENEECEVRSAFVEAILSGGLDTRTRYCSQVKSLYEAVKSADYSELIRAILKLQSSSDDGGGSGEDAAEQEAIHQGLVAALERDDNRAFALIMQYTRAKPTLPDLWLAVRRGNVRAVNVLIEHNVLQESGADELNLDEHKKRVKELLRSSLEMGGSRRRCILIDEMVKVFVDRDDDFVRDVMTMMFHEAVMSTVAGDSDPEGVEVIMHTNMVNICELNARHETIWHLLARSRNAATSLEMAKVILSTSEHMSTSTYLDLQNIDGRTAAQIAFQAGNWELVRLYLENGASPEGIELSSGSSNMKSLAVRDAIGDLIERRLQAELKLRRMMPADPVRYITRDLSAGRERYPISVENCMGDGAELDADFEYSSVVLHRDDAAAFGGRVDFSLGCHCADECRTNCACNTSANCTPLYDGGGRLSEKACELAQSNELGIVSECNSACWCGPGCASRVAQLGIRQRLQIYRSTRYGWAVRCATAIRKGEFICEYAGELIGGVEADQSEDDTYIFEIITQAENDGLSSYCIDARRRGNVSRFINHSCVPNLCAVRVVWDARTTHFPHVCLFANRNIAKGEELTMDYGRQWWEVKLHQFACRCGNKNCVYRNKIDGGLDDENRNIE